MSPVLSCYMDKICKQCKQEKPETEFYKAARNVGGREHQCKACRWETKKASPEALDRGRRKHQLKQYGLTQADYDTMVLTQENKCGICGTSDETRRLSVDHCHLTGRVRGLLCNNCNRSLGMLGDTVESIQKVLSYLLDEES